MGLQALWNRAVLLLTPRPWSRRNNNSIPDEILFKILVKLPAESVLICRCVCRRWKALTSTPEFVQWHSRFSIPRIMCIERKFEKKAELGVVDPWEGGARKSKRRRGIKIHKVMVDSIALVPESLQPQLFGYCYNGLLVFSNDFRLTHFMLLNPLTREDVRLITPPKGQIIGVFLNPFTRDQYRVLWLGSDLRPNGSVDYRIIYLGASGGRGTSKSEITQKELHEEDDALVSYRPRVSNTMVDDVLYWMVGCRYAASRLRTSLPGTKLDHSCAESILKFNTKTEKFSVIPHPGPRDEWCKEDPEHERMHLVEMMNDHGVGSGLCLFDVNLVEPLINMWILKRHREDDGNNRASWVRWHKLDLHMLFGIKNPYQPKKARIRPTAIFNAQVYLTLDVLEGELFAVNLNGDTYERVKKCNNYFAGRPWKAFRPCLVPMGNSKSEIWM